jgi:hypothetical protein
MLLRKTLTAFCLLMLPAGLFAQTTESPLTGLTLAKVPDVVYAQMPRLPAKEGILVEQVLPNSAAASAGLKRHDILLSFDGVPLRDGEQFLKLAADSVAQGRVPLIILRGGQKMILKVALVSPPDTDSPKAMLKPEGPPAVAVHAKNLDSGKMSVTFTYYSKHSSKLESVTCSGSLDEIKKKLKDVGEQKQMPSRVQDLADLALDRLRVLNSPAQK